VVCNAGNNLKERSAFVTARQTRMMHLVHPAATRLAASSKVQRTCCEASKKHHMKSTAVLQAAKCLLHADCQTALLHLAAASCCWATNPALPWNYK
jgi:hypothetical protein